VAKIDLTGILNNRGTSRLNFDYVISAGQPSIGIAAYELAAFLEELKTPLSARLAIVLPLQFTTVKPVPILAAVRPDKGAIVMNKDGKDLFGREGGEASGTMKDVLNYMSSVTLTVSVINNLGAEGYFTMNRAVVDRPAPLPLDDALGRISLSGSSGVTLTKDFIEKTNPFNPAFELFLEGDFDIKRSAENNGKPPLEMNLGVVVQTIINKVF
jgi:hypothetical protein